MKTRETALLQQLDHQVATSSHPCPRVDYIDLPQCFHDYVKNGTVDVKHCLGDCHALAVVEGQRDKKGRTSLPVTRLAFAELGLVPDFTVSNSIASSGTPPCY